MWKLIAGIAILGCCIGIGFIPISGETYQHIRIWSHALWGGAAGIGVVLTIRGLSEA